ncbi:bifunctional transcriptional activator/DNA repair enzyme AdaA [Hyphobacterium sp.]|uniref:bifunctional transcriptional activator/DNA repair enzyme AdaA n=1 Tax=Hyphobacterium sp. TaxID=2004662 RepID=UPI003BAB0ED8
MLFTPSPDELYDALVRRDNAFDGRAFVGVTSTGIFCRLTCPARKPKRKNCQFFETVAQCLEAGYRACKRCHPMTTAAESDPVILDLMSRLNADASRRWSEGDIVRLGYDPSTVRRAFKRHYGMTFLEIARLYRLRDGFEALATGERVIDAQLSAGFESASGFRQAFARLAGKAPFAFTDQEILKAHWLDTPLGPMIAVADNTHLHLLEFADRKALPTELKKLETSAGGIGIGETPITMQIAHELDAFFDGRSARFETPLKLHGSAFTREVWRELIKIPAGATRSYLQLAEAIGNPNATRAVARANGANQIAIVIPCHRVIGADGSLTGYGGGLWRKQKLISLEQQYAKGLNS